MKFVSNESTFWNKMLKINNLITGGKFLVKNHLSMPSDIVFTLKISQVIRLFVPFTKNKNNFK